MMDLFALMYGIELVEPVHLHDFPDSEQVIREGRHADIIQQSIPESVSGGEKSVGIFVGTEELPLLIKNVEELFLPAVKYHIIIHSVL